MTDGKKTNTLTNIVMDTIKENSYQLHAAMFVMLTVTLSISLPALLHLHVTDVAVIQSAYVERGTTLEQEVYVPGMYVSITLQSLGWIAALHELVVKR